MTAVLSQRGQAGPRRVGRPGLAATRPGHHKGGAAVLALCITVTVTAATGIGYAVLVWGFGRHCCPHHAGEDE